jgi:hypothetical protein
MSRIADDCRPARGGASADPFGPIPTLSFLSATEFAAASPLPPPLLGPLFPGTITLIRGPRGAGKSWLALAMGQAVASGGALLGWRARAGAVLHIEGAMGAAALGARLAVLGAGAAERLRLVCDTPLDPGDADDQLRLMDALPEGGLLVLDGLSLMMATGRRGAARWQSLCDWLRLLRREGHAVLLVDHAPRPALAALADTLVTIRPARDGDAAVAFTVAIASRHALRDADRAFAARLDLSGGTACWSRDVVADPELRDVAAAAKAGGTVRDIAASLGLAPATAWRRLNRAKALGLLADGKASETGETDETAFTPLPRERGSGAGNTPRETGETGETAGPPPEAALAKVSTDVLRRTLTRRLEAHRRGAAEKEPRAGPAILAGIADADIVAACSRRLRPAQAARLQRDFAPLQAAAP